jgi:hypothetical protein
MRISLALLTVVFADRMSRVALVVASSDGAFSCS